MAAYFGDRAQARGTQVDRRLAAACSGGPGRVEKLLARAHQVGGSGADPLGVAQHHVRACGELIEQQRHVTDQRGCQ